MASRPGEDNSVPGLPEEWGRIVIPDNPSELDDLARSVRAELYGDLAPSSSERRLPFIVLAATVAITLVSLFLVPWISQMGQTDPVRPSDVAITPEAPSSSSPRARGDCPSSQCGESARESSAAMGEYSLVG